MRRKTHLEKGAQQQPHAIEADSRLPLDAMQYRLEAAQMMEVADVVQIVRRDLVDLVVVGRDDLVAELVRLGQMQVLLSPGTWPFSQRRRHASVLLLVVRSAW